MLYRKVPKTGDELSILGYGCMRLPLKRGLIDEKRATRQLRGAIDRGVNYVDTAQPYHIGASEPFLGRALQGGYREKVRLATKQFSLKIRSAEDFAPHLGAQLKKLQTDYLDYYLLHGINGPVFERMKGLGVLEFLEQAKKDGRIRHTGFSFHGDVAAFKEIVDAYDWDICQIQYNYLDENIQAGTEGLKYAAAKRLGVIIMEPLRGGNLARKIPPAVQAVWDRAERKRTPAEWGLRWVWNHPEVTCVLSGMNEDKHIEENLRIAGEALPDSLSDKELALIRESAEKYQGLGKVACTGCRYCMPCPAGVDIPTCFELYNQRQVFGEKGQSLAMYFLRLYGGIESPRHRFASACTECGNCRNLCPQGLPVPELIREVRKTFENPIFKSVVWFFGGYLAYQKWRFERKRKNNKL